MAIITWIILHAPEVIAIVKELVDLLKNVPSGCHRMAVNDLLANYREYRKTNDATELKKVHDELCSGGECKR